MITTGRTSDTTQIANAANAIENPTAATSTAPNITLVENDTPTRRGGTRNDPSGSMSIVGGTCFIQPTWPPTINASSPPTRPAKQA